MPSQPAQYLAKFVPECCLLELERAVGVVGAALHTISSSDCIWDSSHKLSEGHRSAGA